MVEDSPGLLLLLQGLDCSHSFLRLVNAEIAATQLSILCGFTAA